MGSNSVQWYWYNSTTLRKGNKILINYMSLIIYDCINTVLRSGYHDLPFAMTLVSKNLNRCMNYLLRSQMTERSNGSDLDLSSVDIL